MILGFSILTLGSFIWWGVISNYNQKLKIALSSEYHKLELEKSVIDLELENIVNIFLNKSDPISYVLSTQSNPNNELIVFLLKKILKRNNVIHLCAIVDLEGRVLLGLDQELTDKDGNYLLIEEEKRHNYPNMPELTNSDLEIQIPLHNRIYISSSVGNKLLYNISVPLVNKDSVVGVLYGEIDLRLFWQSQNNCNFEYNTMVIDSKGMLIASIKNNNILLKTGNLMTTNAVVRDLITSDSENIIYSKNAYANSKGDFVYAVGSKTHNLGLIFITEIPREIISTPIYLEIFKFSIIFFIISSLVIVFSHFIFKKFNASIISLTNLFSFSAEGNYIISKEVNPMKEIKGLHSGYNAMVERIKQREEKIAQQNGDLAYQNNKLTEINKIVEERTKALEFANMELELSSNELKNTYKQLSQNEARYRFLAENSYDVVLAYNADLKRTYVSPSIKRLTGFTVSETFKMSLTDCFYPSDAFYLIELYKSASKKREKDRIVRCRRLTKKNEYIWIESAISFVYEKKNKLESIIISMRDISIQIQAENELKETQVKLVQSNKMASLGLLTAGVAHEINNPVNFVTAGINSLEENLIDISKILEAYQLITPNNVIASLKEIYKLKSELKYNKLLYYIKKSTLNIKNGADRTSEIIKGLQSFSRGESGKMKVFVVRECIDNALLLLRNLYKDRIKIVKNYGDAVQLSGHPEKLNQVFLNILVNAIQSIEEKGVIIIDTKKMNRNEINYLEISIADTGEGMTKELKSRIFEPFYTTKEVGKGTGLGLSISHGIIKDHNGFIEVESKVGVGTKFCIYLPL